MKLLLLIAFAGCASASNFFQPLDFGNHNPPDIHFSDSFCFKECDSGPKDDGPKWDGPKFNFESYGKPVDCDPEPIPQSGVPEPATFGVMGLGLIGIAAIRFRL